MIIIIFYLTPTVTSYKHSVDVRQLTLCARGCETNEVWDLYLQSRAHKVGSPNQVDILPPL